MKLTYVTGNAHKFESARKFLSEFGIELVQETLKIPEIQSNDATEVAIQKARDAWEHLRVPLFVNDASWSIPALKGFPGPYMRYVNEWFEPIDFIRLMEGKTDRRVILRDTIVYIDEHGHTVFSKDHFGTILPHPTLGKYRHPSDAIISLSRNGASIQEEIEKGTFFIEDEGVVWNEFAEWFKTHHG